MERIVEYFNQSEIEKKSQMTHGLRDGKLLYDAKPQRFLNLLSDIHDNLELVIVVGVTMALLYVFLVWKRTRKECKSVEVSVVKPRERDWILHRSLVRSTSIISHKLMLETLEHAANNCNVMRYSLKCIDIIVYCPQLMNVKSKYDGLTPFHRVCLQGNTCLIQFMLGKGADPFTTTYAGEDALCMAVYHVLSNPTKNNFSCLKVLVEAGCNLKLTNRYDKFLESAVNNKHANLVHWLILHADGESRVGYRSCSVP